MAFENVGFHAFFLSLFVSVNAALGDIQYAIVVYKVARDDTNIDPCVYLNKIVTDAE